MREQEQNRQGQQDQRSGERQKQAGQRDPNSKTNPDRDRASDQDRKGGQH